MKGNKAHCFTIIMSEREILDLILNYFEQTCNFSVIEHNRDLLYCPPTFINSYISLPKRTRFEIQSSLLSSAYIFKIFLQRAFFKLTQSDIDYHH